MPFALICRDKPGALGIRKASREEHLAYAAHSGVVSFGGPFLDDEGQMCGSLLILNVETMEEARAWAAGDPYKKAGLFDSVTIDAFKQTVG